MDFKRRKHLGELLIEDEIITQEQLKTALLKQKELGELLGVILMKLGYINEETDILPFIAWQYGVDIVNLRQIEISEEAISKIPVKTANRYCFIPVSFKDNVLTVAISKPHDLVLRDMISMINDCNIKLVLASEKDIKEAIKKHYGIGAETMDQIMEHTVQAVEETTKEEDDEVDNADSEATICNFLDQIFMQAYERRATDIHIEPFEDNLKIRFRIDGMLYDIKVPEEVKYFKNSINSRIKIISKLDIAERRMPQDGRFRMRVGSVDLDLRVSFLPTQNGEGIAIRLLNSSKLFDFNDLDLDAKQRYILENLIKKPHGIVFITGPTGSGKTTTLYSCLSCINTAEKKIITIEDPVEYQLGGITQIQINPCINLTFAQGLRSMLRHDPDVIMVGEVRDVDTAEIAIQSALTGHLIFSTLHTNDAAGGVARLLNMGVEPFLITSTVECFVAQRLVRLLCPKCKKPKKMNPNLMKKLEIDKLEDSQLTVFKEVGCSHCNNTGYFGRAGIFEFLELNDDINNLILARASASQIKNQAVKMGMKTLRQSGWDKVRKGLTSPEEIIRVTQGRSSRK